MPQGNACPSPHAPDDALILPGLLPDSLLYMKDFASPPDAIGALWTTATTTGMLAASATATGLARALVFNSVTVTFCNLVNGSDSCLVSLCAVRLAPKSVKAKIHSIVFKVWPLSSKVHEIVVIRIRKCTRGLNCFLV